VSKRRDGGARFLKCDLQVHSPRDAQWRGEFADADTDAKREVWAEALVHDCIKKKLDLIAITDHHDCCMHPYVQQAAGKLATTAHRLTVLPGIELTLATPPIQAIILFDAMVSLNRHCTMPA
jgi:chromosome segregation protein